MVENPSGVVEAVRRGLEYDPTARGVPFDLAHYQKLLARSLLSLGRPAEAEQPLEAILAGGRGSSGETDPEANWLLSRVFLQQGRIADASAALARAGAYRSDNPLAPEPSPYVGASQCTECHRDEEREYRLTRHFRTFHHGADLLKLPIPAHPLPDPDDPEIIHTFERDADKIQLKTRTGDRVYKMVVEYAFGTRERYITMIGRDDHGDFRAFRLSHYHDKNESGWIRTFGSPSDDELVRGQAIPARDGVNRCLYCHVTQPRDYRDPPPESGPTPAVADAGIGCERCHGPGANHIAAIKYDFHDRAIVNAGASTAANINTQCAECHIVGLPSEIGQEPDNPRYVRSSAATMPFSRCYNESGGRLSCLTCHDPHTDSEKSPAYYESRCLKCHSQASTLASTDAGAVAPRSNPVPARATTCPVNPTKNCLECHMPKIDVPVLKTRMTDHFIRIRDRK